MKIHTEPKKSKSDIQYCKPFGERKIKAMCQWVSYSIKELGLIVTRIHLSSFSCSFVWVFQPTWPWQPQVMSAVMQCNGILLSGWNRELFGDTHVSPFQSSCSRRKRPPFSCTMTISYNQSDHLNCEGLIQWTPTLGENNGTRKYNQTEDDQ